ncbi:MAG: hypothetical protein ACJATA_001241 [Sphingobacteriales bacterium]|jgi:hypothetical protein
MDFKVLLKKAWPHIAAVGIFIVLSVAYCSPILQGKRLVQNDIVQWRGQAAEALDFKETTGETTNWSNNMFGGMPTYQTVGAYDGNVFSTLTKIFKLGIPRPASQVMVLCAGVYILLLCFGLSPWLSIIGAIMFGFSTFNLVSIEAGHNSKIMAMALMGPIVGGLYLALNKKYFTGGLLFSLFLGLELRANHLQITYYLMIICVLVLIHHLLTTKPFDVKSYLKAGLVLVIGLIFAVGPNFGRLYTTLDYSKETIRGGNSELATKEEKKSTGLDIEYAYRWSYGIAESFTVLIPNLKGGATGASLSENSATYKELIKKGVPKQNAKQYITQQYTYWGDQPFTSGPVYYGAGLCFLFILGLLIIEKKYKVLFIAVTLVSFILAWGRNFGVVNEFLFYNLPMYNKFRTPAMALVISQLSMVVLALITLKRIFKNPDKNYWTGPIKKSAYITGGLLLVFGLIGSFVMDFVGTVDSRINPEWLVGPMREDRASMLRMDTLRSILFAGLTIGLIWALLAKKLKTNVVIFALALISLVDLWGVGKRYFNDSKFVKPKNYEQNFQPSVADRQIIESEIAQSPKVKAKVDSALQSERAANKRLSATEEFDVKRRILQLNSNYRVFNVTKQDPFSDALTSYFHKSVGGYHAAKLTYYNDMISRHIGRGNNAVLNMLNTRYYIVEGSNKQPTTQKNNRALGNAWFVSNVKWAANAQAEIDALNGFNPSQEVVIDQRFKTDLTGLSDSLFNEGSIELIDYKPNKLVYNYSNDSDGFAVFSEIYYNHGKDWNAYLDGEKMDHIRVNYILRGMKLPKGDHSLVFKFEPASFALGEKVDYASSIGFLVFLAVMLFGIFKFERKEEEIA